MQFKLFTVVAAALSATTGVQALPAAADVVPGLPSPESVISNIQSLTQLAGDTKNIVGGLNALNAPTSAFVSYIPALAPPNRYRGLRDIGPYVACHLFHAPGKEDIDSLDWPLTSRNHSHSSPASATSAPSCRNSQAC